MSDNAPKLWEHPKSIANRLKPGHTLAKIPTLYHIAKRKFREQGGDINQILFEVVEELVHITRTGKALERVAAAKVLLERLSRPLPDDEAMAKSGTVQITLATGVPREDLQPAPAPRVRVLTPEEELFS